jgi:tRNA(fMet)-specific endonuclease VapC
MTGEVLLDTSVVVAHFRGDQAVTERLLQSDVVYMPVIAVGELYYGALKAVAADEALREVETFLGAVSILDADRGAALRYSRIKKGLADRGTPIPENDIWIAAIAAQHELPLANRDAHFRQIKDGGPELLDW